MFSHLAWVNTPRNKGGLGGISFPLVADVTKSIAKDYGVLIEDGDDAGIALRCAARPARAAAERWWPPAWRRAVTPSRGKALCQRATLRPRLAVSALPIALSDSALPRLCSGLFIINEAGVLRQITVNDLPVGRSVDEVLRLVNAFKHVDKHGEVCPAGWTPGAATMKADPKGSLEYFSTVK